MKLTAPSISMLRVALLVVVPVGFGAPLCAAPKPNILHIHADDHRADGLHALGTAALKTPNLDTIVEHGMAFTHCYTMGSMVGAVCLPSRTMMLTGRSWLRIPGPRSASTETNAAALLPGVLKAAGYETWHMGKSGNEFRAGIQAFDVNLVDDGKGSGSETGRALSSKRHADQAVAFLKSRDTSRPFYIYLAPPVPHDPRVAEPQFHTLYSAADIPLSAAFLPLHPWDNGDMAVRDEKLAPWPRTPQDTRQQLADYYACVTGLDHHVGRIFTALKESGQWENTIIVFTGDNGLSLGEHGLFGKQNLYEFGGMHVPCVMAGPGIPRGRSQALVYLMDLFPTFCDFGGARVPDGVEGRSLRPLLEGRQTRLREVLYTGYLRCQRAIRDDRWKLIRYPLVDRTQLFDLQTDPRELNNLAGQSGYASRVAAMMALLEREMRAYADDAPLTIANPRPAAWTPPATTNAPAKPRAARQRTAN
jgi:arylsulfatase A-like enzyme